MNPDSGAYMEIILDTSFLLVPFQFHIDIITEIRRICDFPYTLSIMDRTMDELDSIISVQGGANARAARFALTLLAKEGIARIQTESLKNVDQLILKLAHPESHIIATQDKGLKRKLREKGFHIIEMRQKSHLMLS